MSLFYNTPEGVQRVRQTLHWLTVAGAVPPKFRSAFVEGTLPDPVFVQIYAKENPPENDEPLATYLRTKQGRLEKITKTPEVRNMRAEHTYLPAGQAVEPSQAPALGPRKHTKQFRSSDERLAFLAGITYGAVMNLADYKLRNFDTVTVNDPSDTMPFKLVLHTEPV
jgi:hypothetical protein